MGRSNKKRRPAAGGANGVPEGAAPRDASGSASAELTAGVPRVPWLRSRGPAVRAVVIFVVLMGLFYGLVHTPATDSERFEPYLALIARISGTLIDLFEKDVEVHGSTIIASRFPVQIVRGCDGLEPIAVFIAAVLASPVVLRSKLAGVAVGVICLWVVNLIRIITLVLIGIHARAAFHLVHEQVWQAAFIVLAIVFWAIWVQWATRSKTVGADAAA